MFLSFSPESLDFGEVVVNQPVTKSVTITNETSNETIVTAPSGAFSMSPPIEKLAVGASVTVHITFTPTATGSFSGTLSGVSDSCVLTGTGVAQSQDAETTVTTKKAFFINVPDFSDGTFEQRKPPNTVQQTMSSFLRLGTFDYDTEPPNARALLKLIHQAGPPGDPALPTNQKWAFDPEKDEFSDAPPFKARASDEEANKANTREVFFLDDARLRDVDVAVRDGTSIDDNAIKGHGLSRRQRQEESARLYSRGGWRDHSDGNRITTTYGDKVEVIRGNYKMVILGRQDNPGEAMGWDVAGSHVTDYAPGTMPGATFWHEWVPDYKFTDSTGVKRTGVWLLVNTTEGVYQYARYAGTFKTEQWGDLFESYIGSENPPKDPVTSKDRATSPDASYGTQGHNVPTENRIDGIDYDEPLGTANNRAGPSFALDNKDVIRSNPHIVERRWARRIDSWTGSEALPVPEIEEKRFADHVKGDTGSSSKRVKTMDETLWVEKKTELVDISETVLSNYRAGSILEARTAGTILGSTTAASIQSLTTAGAVLEVGAFGQKTAMSMGSVLDMFIGAQLSISLAPKLDIGFKTDEIVLEKTQSALSQMSSAFSQGLNALQATTVALQSVVQGLKVDLGV